MGESTPPLRERIAERADGTQKRLDQTLAGMGDRLSVRSARVGQVLVYSAAAFSYGAAAQSGTRSDAAEVLCGSGIGAVLSIVFIIAAMALVVKATFSAMMALDKKGSSSSKTQHEGREKGKDAAYTFMGAFIPGLLAALIEVMNVGMASCLNPGSWSIVGVVTVLPF